MRKFGLMVSLLGLSMGRGGDDPGLETARGGDLGRGRCPRGGSLVSLPYRILPPMC